MKSVLAFAAALFLTCAGSTSSAQEKYDAQWMWFDAGNPGQSAPAGKAWFRREIRAFEPSTGSARILCDDRFTLWVNGVKVGTGEPRKLARFNLNGIVERGPNVIAIEAETADGKAGLFVDGEIRSQSGNALPFDSGATWQATNAEPEGDAWLKPKFEGKGWKSARALGAHAKSPWKEIVLKESYLDQFDVPQGFELIRIGEPQVVGSLIAMTWGNRGRLIGSREGGPIVSLVDDNKDGTYDKAIPYSEELKSCQGLLMVGDDLYAVGEGPKGSGMYVLPDKNHDDKADEARLIVLSQGNIGEHGPHNIVLGPDGWLYHNLGNHAHIIKKPEPNTAVRRYDEDYLLNPKFEDAGGHAVGKKAPGGTIWRFTPDGKQWWCETNGFRNEYDIAFNQAGELFSFDSDMEWDVGAYWYRPVRVNHCVPGAEFGWRSGAAKWPAYYFDSLPATVDVGRGSPTGVVFYEHKQFPEKFRGSFLICDWSMGRILAVPLQPAGATYTGKFETLLSGNPLNVSDIEVDRDGSVVFVVGGRGTEGGVYRIRAAGEKAEPATATTVAELLALPQTSSGWAREIAAAVKASLGSKWSAELTKAAMSGEPEQRLRALTWLNQLGPKPSMKVLLATAGAAETELRAFGTHLLGFQPADKVREPLNERLSDSEPWVRRRACEAFIRAGIEPPLDQIMSHVASDDRWLRFSARLALERIPTEKWQGLLRKSGDPRVMTEGLLALYRGDRKGSAAELLDTADELLGGTYGELAPEQKLNTLRIVELALIDGKRTESSAKIGQRLLKEFPTGRPEIDAESARILAALDVDGAVAKILPLVEKSPDHGVQLHYALTLRYINSGWTSELKQRLLTWYEGTRDWEGGHSLTGYVTNVVAAASEKLTPEERRAVIQNWSKRPVAAGLVIRNSDADQIAGFQALVTSALEESAKSGKPGDEELIGAAIESLGRSRTEASRKLLRTIWEEYPDRRDGVARAMASKPANDDGPLLLKTLQAADTTTAQLCLGGLAKLDQKPKTYDAYRTVIQSGHKLGDRRGRAAVELLRKWTGERDEAGSDVSKGLAFFSSWYEKKYPDAPSAAPAKDDTSTSKYTLAQVSDLVDKGHAADPGRGRLVFTKAKCVKCHKFQNEGDAVGPDLTSVRRRFQKKEIVESVVRPSEVISDQYRMVQVETLGGLVHTGMPVPSATNNDNLVLLMADATKLEIPKSEIDVQSPSKISVMPAGLLDPLTNEEIADLFAFMETSKFNAPSAEAGKK